MKILKFTKHFHSLQTKTIEIKTQLNESLPLTLLEIVRKKNMSCPHYQLPPFKTNSLALLKLQILALSSLAHTPCLVYLPNTQLVLVRWLHRAYA